MLHTRSSRPDLSDPALARRWDALCPHGSPFLSWAWVACLTGTRCPNPVLIETLDGDTLVGAALFNRRRRRLHLHESGDAAQDSVFIEHNGAVTAAGRRADVLQATFRAALRLVPRATLSGLDDQALAAARAAGTVMRLHTRPAPFRARPPGGDLAPCLGRSTRAQLRRSERAYAEWGPLALHTAATVPQALDWLAAMLPLHAATWSARGIDSGFLAPPVQRFHRALIERGVPDGTVLLQRVSAGSRPIGYLLNLRAGSRVANYQGGFDYPAAPPGARPGLSCHAAAMEAAWASDATEYDFLAGDARYKRSLSDGVRDLHWCELVRPASLAGLEALIRRLLGR